MNFCLTLKVNFAAFDSTFEVDTPVVSTYELSLRGNRTEDEKTSNQIDFQVSSFNTLPC